MTRSCSPSTLKRDVHFMFASLTVRRAMMVRRGAGLWKGAAFPKVPLPGTTLAGGNRLLRANAELESAASYRQKRLKIA
jgi:hypothetical protein